MSFKLIHPLCNSHFPDVLLCSISLRYSVWLYRAFITPSCTVTLYTAWLHTKSSSSHHQLALCISLLIPCYVMLCSIPCHLLLPRLLLLHLLLASFLPPEIGSDGTPLPASVSPLRNSHFPPSVPPVMTPSHLLRFLAPLLFIICTIFFSSSRFGINGFSERMALFLCVVVVFLCLIFIYVFFEYILVFRVGNFFPYLFFF